MFKNLSSSDIITDNIKLKISLDGFDLYGAHIGSYIHVRTYVCTLTLKLTET